MSELHGIDPFASPQALPVMPIETAVQKRPVGVWIATIWAGLFAGVIPLLVEIFLLFDPFEIGIWSTWSLLFSIALAIAIIAASIGAFIGNSTSRYLLVILVVVHYSMVAYNNFHLLNLGVEIGGGPVRLIGRAIRSLITAAIFAAYLTLNRRARLFFSRR